MLWRLLFALAVFPILPSTLACGTPGDSSTAKTPLQAIPVYAVLVQRANGTMDRYPVDFKPDLVQSSGDTLLISGTRNGIAVDFYPIALNPGDRFAGFEGVETPQARDGERSPTPTVISGPSPGT